MFVINLIGHFFPDRKNWANRFKYLTCVVKGEIAWIIKLVKRM